VTEVNTLLVQNREQLGTLISEGALLAKKRVTLSKVNNGLGDGRDLDAARGRVVDAAHRNTTMTTLTPSVRADDRRRG
jgi:hypothetical protein